MRQIIYIEGRQFRNDSVVPKTHVVIGQLDAEKERPRIIKTKEVDGAKVEFEATKLDEMTDEEWQKVHDHVVAATSGRFRLKPLDWYQSEEEANKMAEHFKGQGYINVKVRDILEIGSIHENA